MNENKDKQARQGDVFFEKVANLPDRKDLKMKSDPILAYGEVTGHSHKIMSPPMSEVDSYVDKNGDIYVQSSQEITVGHDEHDTITLPADTLYCVTIQREYDPAAAELERRVAD